nr:hypothetical protein [Candidatus Sigynarchaeota archaeon]
MDINDLLFALYSIEVFLDFELCVFFLMKGKPKATRHIAILGLAYAFFGITRIFLIFWDFESVPPHTGYEMLYIIGAFFAFLAMSVFLHAAETLIRKTKHVFTICFLALSGIIPVLPYKTVQSIYYFFTPVLIFFVIIFLFLLMAMTSGSTRKKFFFVSIGLIVFGLGYALSTAFMKAIINNAILPPSLVLVGLTLTGIGFINIPSLYEIHWDDSLLHIFVFHIDTSVCIYDETLIKVGKESNISADLFSSGVTGIINIIKEMVQSDKKLKVLDHEDKKILLEYGKHITVALVAIKDLNTLHEKLHTYIERTETDFKKQFEKWNG